MTSSSASSCFFFAINLKRNTLYSLESRMQYLTFALLLERTYSYHYDENYILEQVRAILHLQGFKFKCIIYLVLHFHDIARVSLYQVIHGRFTFIILKRVVASRRD